MIGAGSDPNFELAVVLPLGVAANQLLKVESELRFLSAKLAGFRQERGSGRGEAAARLEQMSESLDAIRQLIADIQADFDPGAVAAARRRNDRED